MDDINKKVQPAIESGYEDPSPSDQKAWNLGITTVIAIVAAIFLIAIIAAIVAFR